MSDIWSDPQGLQPAPADKPDTAPQYGSLERGIAGDYRFSIGETLSEAWAKSNGAKLTIHIALLIYFVVAVGAMIVMGLLIGFGAITGAQDGPESPGSMIGVQIISQIVSAAVFGPMGAGLFIIGLRRSVNAPVSAGTVLAYFSKILPILLMMILMYVLVLIGFVLFIIPGIYLSVAYYLALPLIVEKNLGPWEALEASRKAITKRWFAIFGLFVVLTLINLATVVTLFIGMIWTIPMSVIAFGILYRNIFGVEAATLNA
jgi:hypothetical protein